MDAGSIVAIVVAAIGIGPGVWGTRQITKERRARQQRGSLEDRAQTLEELRTYTHSLLQELNDAREDREECERKRELLEQRFDAHREFSERIINELRQSIRDLQNQIYNLQNPTSHLGGSSSS